MLNLIYKKLKDEFLSIARDDVEVGCNIYYDNDIYIDDITVGTENGLELPINDFIIGTFHTHIPDMNSWGFSPQDIISGIIHRERYMFLKVDNDIYGVDLSKYQKSINKLAEKKISVDKLVEMINDGKVMFYD